MRTNKKQAYQQINPAIARVDSCNSPQIITVAHHSATLPSRPPNLACQNHWQKFLESNALTLDEDPPMAAVDSNHGNCSHSQVSLLTAPQPHEPEALDQTWYTPASSFGMMEMPFHSTMNVLHQKRLARPSTFRCIWCQGLQCRWPAWSLNKLLMKVFPGQTTWLVWASRPTSNSKFFLVHDLSLSLARMAATLSTSCFSSLSLACGRRTTIATESISNPRNVRHVMGPSSLSMAIHGKPQCRKRLKEAPQACRVLTRPRPTYQQKIVEIMNHKLHTSLLDYPLSCICKRRKKFWSWPKGAPCG